MGVWDSPPVPTFTAGQPVFGADLQKLADIASALTGPGTSWSPTLTNITQGSGVITAKYWQIGDRVDYRFKFVLGAGSAMGTSPRFTLPVAPSANYVATEAVSYDAMLLDNGAASYQAVAVLLSGSTAQVNSWSSTVGQANITSTAPFTWVSGDSLTVKGFYYTD